MLTTRQLVPSSVAHIVCPLLLQDGTTVFLTAMGSLLKVQQPVWKTDRDGKESCVFVPTRDELHVGSVAVALVACAHQCFLVLTQDCEILVGRYQANLPAPPNSWLCNDVLHHSNAWIVLYRGKFSASQAGGSSIPDARPLFATGMNGTTVQCSILRGVMHTIIIGIPNNAPNTFFREKWLLSIPQSVGPFSYGVAPFRRDVIEQSDEELLMHCTVAELAERKHLESPPPVTQSYGFPPVSVTLLHRNSDDRIMSMGPMPAKHSQGPESFAFVFANRSSLSVLGVFSSSSRGKLLKNLTVSGSPYFALTLPDRMLVLSLLGCVHVLSILAIDATTQGAMLTMVSGHRTVRIARSMQHPFAAVLLQRCGSWEVLWLLLENGLLTEVSLEILQSCNGNSDICDAPNIQSGDCEDGEWPIACIRGLPHGFRATSILPFNRGHSTNFQPHPVTQRYVLLGDGISDTYIVDLVERCAVGGLLSHGAMTSACSGPDMDIVVTYSKGMLQRLSPGVVSPLRVHAAFAGVHQMYALPHMNASRSLNLTLYFLVTTATRTALLRGAAGCMEELQETEEFVLDEPTLAAFSAPPDDEKAELSSPPSLSFAQCTPTCLNLAGTRNSLREILSRMDCASNACFAGDEFLAVADSQRVTILSIKGRKTPHVILQERVSGDVSHLAAWRLPESSKWAVASCLWSQEIVVWLLGEGDVKRHVLPVDAVVLSGFSVMDGGVGLNFINRTVAVLHYATAEGLPFLTAMEDVDGGAFRAEMCLSVTAVFGLVARPHFNLVAVNAHVVELLLLGPAAVVEERLRVALFPLPLDCRSGINDNSSGSDERTSADGACVRPRPLRCGFVLYFSAASFYMLVLSDGMGIAMWSFPDLVPPGSTNATRFRRNGALQRGPVKYQESHAIQLPFITAYDHRLTKAIYMPLSNTIVALTDRGEDISLVSAVDAEAFRVVDGLPMASKEIPMCIESLSGPVEDVVVIGTAVQSAGVTTDPASGRLLLVHVKPLRVSSVACIANGGAIDISVQGYGGDHLIAVASMDRVLVYRLTGLTLSPVCSAEMKSACTTVALCYPFLSCGLYTWGTQYMQLLPRGRAGGDAEEWETASIDQEDDKRGNSQGFSNSNTWNSRMSALKQADIFSWTRLCGVGFTLKTCALEPTAFAGVHSQAVYGDELVRVDNERNVMTVSFWDPPGLVADEAPDTRVVGLDGSYSSMITRCLRLPSRPLRVQPSEQWRLPWRYRKTPFLTWCDRLTALWPVGPTLLFPCADGSLHCAGEIPSAFASPLLRLEQRITELYDTTLSLSRQGCGAGLRRTYHSLSFEAAGAVQSATRVLRKQFVLYGDAIEEFFLLTRLTEMPDPRLTAEEHEWITRKKQLMDAHVKQVWEEYAGELQEVDVCDILHLW
ncbi:hypothetical protein C3747_92g130 [Trypanosoma cruzi]|uniref:Uncharacterized protein n=2 Tax=Trypanosoma cruzi TaxID=5693 RepID=Q4D0T8_TRYCC|nr:hypothetical protein, conserved [Trypanosoma cruzi]EAN86139.1 hypothetical protein, conserved [Trypanosoma cruzi]PWV08216.1 hypothetical protein C3747_92g130 [Trypanosoma cruzi]RNC49548.1 hypothetical protein TcCL_NonESM00411 [Trypanosoma cruzi]|eukprot:XP_807990.1 hypothetical protein [Trypanosoma cruzi strain CL Brener]